MLAAMRAAYRQKDYHRLLSLVVQDVSGYTDAEQGELVFYRAFTCYIFKWKSGNFKRLGRSLIDQAVDLLAKYRHPLLVPALITASSLAQDCGDVTHATRTAETAMALAKATNHPRIYDAAWVRLTSALAAHDASASDEPSLMLQAWLSRAEYCDNGPIYGPFWTAMLLSDAAQANHDPDLSLRMLEKADSLLGDRTYPAELNTSHACTDACMEARKYTTIISHMARFRMDLTVLQRTRVLRNWVAAMPHLCPDLELGLWLSLAEAAVSLSDASIHRYTAAALHAFHCQAGSHAHHVIRLHRLLKRSAEIQPAPVHSKVADLLRPEDWPHWPGTGDLATADLMAVLIPALEQPELVR